MARMTKGTKVLSATTVAAMLTIAVCWLGATAVTTAADAPANPEGLKLFEAKIRPILADNCVGCHGPDKQKGKLRLDTREGLIKGGMDEDKVVKVIEPGDPDKSMIIEAVNYKNEDIQMPPPKKKENRKLSDEQIKDLTEWVKLGAPYGEKPVESTKKPDEK